MTFKKSKTLNSFYLRNKLTLNRTSKGKNTTLALLLYIGTRAVNYYSTNTNFLQ